MTGDINARRIAQRAELARIAKLLAGLELLRGHEQWPDYGNMDIAALRLMRYDEMWRETFRRSWYDHVLTDGAMLQFRFSANGGESFGYLPSPKATLSYKEFVSTFFEVSVEEVGEAYSSEYEDYIDTEPLSPHVTPIRYDWAPRDYVPGRHPAAHLHVGCDNNLRIGSQRRWTATSFVLLILRQVFPDEWMTLRKRCPDALDGKTIFRVIRSDLELVSNPMHYADDSDEVYLR